MRAAILLIASFIGASVLRAQTWRLQESTTTLKGPQHELLPRPGGDIITITHPEAGHNGSIIVSRFDAQLNELYTRRIDGLSHEQYQAAWYADNRLFLFTTDSYGGLTRYELDDLSGGLTGTPLPLTGLLGLSGKAKNAHFYSGHSAPGGYHYIAASTGSMIHGIVLDAQGNKVTHFQCSTTIPPADPVFIQTVNGDLSIILSQSAILHITTEGACNTLPLTGLPNVRYLSWSARNQALYFSALANKTGNETGNTAFTGILTGTVDPATGAVSGLQHTTVAALMTPALQHELQGLPQDLSLLRQLPLSDGSRIVLFEHSGRHLYHNQWSSAMQNPVSAFGRGGSGAGGFTSISPGAQGKSYLSRGDVYVLKLDTGNTPQWLDILSKDQEESDRLTAIGVGCLVDTADNLHVFFYDNRNNANAWEAKPTPVRADDPQNNAFACISITPDGTEKKQFITLTDNHYRLMPEIAFVGNKDQACFLAVRAKPGFSNELAFDRAGYKLGVISPGPAIAAPGSPQP